VTSPNIKGILNGFNPNLTGVIKGCYPCFVPVKSLLNPCFVPVSYGQIMTEIRSSCKGALADSFWSSLSIRRILQTT